MFILYSAEVIDIVGKCGFSVHAYADDLQISGDADVSGCASLVTRLSAFNGRNKRMDGKQ